MTVTTNPVEFDPFSEEFFNDPYELYGRLRDEAPVYYSERYGFYALSRFSDVTGSTAASTENRVSESRAPRTSNRCSRWGCTSTS